jgi:hypothetical protein
MIQKTFDCVEYQRKIRTKFVQEADSNIDKFFALIEQKTKKSKVNKKLIERMQLDKQLTN